MSMRVAVTEKPINIMITVTSCSEGSGLPQLFTSGS